MGNPQPGGSAHKSDLNVTRPGPLKFACVCVVCLDRGLIYDSVMLIQDDCPENVRVDQREIRRARRSVSTSGMLDKYWDLERSTVEQTNSRSS